MKDLGPLKYFLGIKIARNPGGMFLYQSKHTLEIIFEASLMGAKPATTLLDPNNNLAKAFGPIFSHIRIGIVDSLGSLYI